MLTTKQVEDVLKYIIQIREQNEAIHSTLSDIIYKIKELQEENEEDDMNV